MRFFGWNIDFLGFSASFVCAVHCISLPVILSLGMFSGSAWLNNEALEITLIVCSVMLASYSLGKSYLKEHRKIRPLLWLIPGVAFLLLAHDLPGNWHHYFMALGGFTLALAHYINWRLLSAHVPVAV